jgi:2-C-methyl-D-erythritol 2,4-cyclodiphosphate synthase
VDVEFELGLQGHSDADVLTHAVIDALLGAAALGDIGQHFADDDPAYAGADSLVLLAEAATLVVDAGFQVANVDATVVLERPKLGPHRASMEANLAGAIGIAVERVSVKATGGEGMGFVGRGEGAAALAVATIEG